MPHRTATVSTPRENTHSTAKNGRNIAEIPPEFSDPGQPSPQHPATHPQPSEIPEKTSPTDTSASAEEIAGVQGDDHHPLALLSIAVHRPAITTVQVETLVVASEAEA